MFTQVIRRQFLDYFKAQKHAIIPSSSVVPHDDPTLLFNNAGMNQFKDVFLGNTHRDYSRASTSQKCIRVGGKHNDLENVGHTSRHLTFFEMLGNFSFGDYFKKEAIRFAWEVSTTIFGFEENRIWPTVFRDDDEAFELWTQYVPADRITRFGEKENFWSMGDTGPCGPCSELLYDRGGHFGSARNPSEDLTGERFLEFWNLVFMQYNKHATGEITPLPKPSIDTGAGLERILNLKLGVETVFETDVLRSIIAQVETVSGTPYHPHDNNAAAFRVIADHLRCLAFAIADGTQPSNVDRGYVLRKVLRRAVRYGKLLGMDKPFLANVLPQLVSTMGPDYPELVKGQDRIAEILTIEEENFYRTLKRGGNILNQIIDQSQSGTRTISGEDAFKLKDTYGLPFEEIKLIAKDSNLAVDDERFTQLEHEARERSRAVHKSFHQIATDSVFADFLKKNGETEFVGYTHPVSEGTVVGIVINGEFVSEIENGEEGLLILSKTPFYAEMGGQVGDTGHIEGINQHFSVVDCLSPYKGLIAHQGKLESGILTIGDSITAYIDEDRRQKIANNHTATHLLHWALHNVLGEHIKQAGSVVDPQRLRFDFNHHKALTLKELRDIEDIVNSKIRENLVVRGYEMRFDEVQTRQDIKQFFGDKYGTQVRVIDIDYSKELCGGTHTTAVGNIGLFRILKESSIAAGVRRIEAVTGHEAELFNRQIENNILGLSEILKCPVHLLQEKLNKLLEENKQLAHDLKEMKIDQLRTYCNELTAKQEMIGQLPVLISEATLTMEELRLSIDLLAERIPSGIIIIASTIDEKCQIIVKVSEDIVKKGISANDLIKLMMPIVEGSGGGKQIMAQGGGKAFQRLNEALTTVKKHLSTK